MGKSRQGCVTTSLVHPKDQESRVHTLPDLPSMLIRGVPLSQDTPQVLGVKSWIPHEKQLLLFRAMITSGTSVLTIAEWQHNSHQICLRLLLLHFISKHAPCKALPCLMKGKKKLGKEAAESKPQACSKAEPGIPNPPAQTSPCPCLISVTTLTIKDLLFGVVLAAFGFAVDIPTSHDWMDTPGFSLVYHRLESGLEFDFFFPSPPSIWWKNTAESGMG